MKSTENMSSMPATKAAIDIHLNIHLVEVCHLYNPFKNKPRAVRLSQTTHEVISS